MVQISTGEAAALLIGLVMLQFVAVKTLGAQIWKHQDQRIEALEEHLSILVEKQTKKYDRLKDQLYELRIAMERNGLVTTIHREQPDPDKT